MSRPNVLALASESSLPRSLFGRPSKITYRAAVAQIIRDVKARHHLSNERLAEIVGCHGDTISNAENEAGDLAAVTLLSIAYAFGEDAIAPARGLYLCAPADEPTAADRLERIERECAALRKEMGQ